jgi:hypothetical protein
MNMLFLFARASRLLRLSAFLLLVLSIVIRPVLEQISGMHEVEHAALAATDMGQGHGYAHHGTATDPDDSTELQCVKADCAASPALSSSLALTLAIQPSDAPPLPTFSCPRLGIPATPFRPPIA